MTPKIVVDTNVLAISERLEENASESCINACTQIAERIHDGRAILVVDELGEILSEYLTTLDRAKTAGIGVKVARLLRQRSGLATVCHKVSVHLLDDNSGCYEEVPPSLRDFDTDDQKFIAVANAEQPRPKLFAGRDGEWWERSNDFAAEGFDVQFPCSDDLMNGECE